MECHLTLHSQIAFVSTETVSLFLQKMKKTWYSVQCACSTEVMGCRKLRKHGIVPNYCMPN